MDHKNDCFICGKELVYLEENEDMECYYCKEIHPANARCAAGHYVCDRCHSMAGDDLIEAYCLRSTSRDPPWRWLSA